MGRKSTGNLPSAAARAQLDAEYAAIAIHWLEGRLMRFVQESMPLRDRALALGDTAYAAEIAFWMAAGANLAWDRNAEDYITRAERLAKAAELPALGARLQGLRARLSYLRGDPIAMEAAARRELAAAEEAGDPQAAAAAHLDLGETLLEQVQLGEAKEELTRALEAGEQAGDVQWLIEAHLGRALLALELNELESADDFVAQALALVREEHVTVFVAIRLALAQVRAAQRRDDEADRAFRDAIDTIGPTEYRRLVVDATIAYARFLAERDRLIEAEALIWPVEGLLQKRGYQIRRSEIADIRALVRTRRKAASAVPTAKRRRTTGSRSGATRSQA
ncbi:MAG: hypothetical protein ACRDF7_04955 [Candidatus Limnocylindrales bacterium]